MYETLSEKLIIKNEFAELKQLLQWVEYLQQSLQLSTKTAFHLDLVLTEVVTNILSYAFDDTTAVHFIHLHCLDTETVLDLEIIDDGKPFNPLAFALPEQTSDLHTTSITGRGIPLILSYTQNQKYCYTTGRNILKLELAKEH